MRGGTAALAIQGEIYGPQERNHQVDFGKFLETQVRTPENQGAERSGSIERLPGHSRWRNDVVVVVTWFGAPPVRQGANKGVVYGRL